MDAILVSYGQDSAGPLGNVYTYEFKAFKYDNGLRDDISVNIATFAPLFPGIDITSGAFELEVKLKCKPAPKVELKEFK